MAPSLHRQDVLPGAMKQYRSKYASPIQFQKETVAVFHLEYSKQRKEIFFFSSFISALKHCYRIPTDLPDAAGLETSNPIRLAEILLFHL
jgi:hypothetical protein